MRRTDTFTAGHLPAARSVVVLATWQKASSRLAGCLPERWKCGLLLGKTAIRTCRSDRQIPCNHVTETDVLSNRVVKTDVFGRNVSLAPTPPGDCVGGADSRVHHVGATNAQYDGVARIDAFATVVSVARTRWSPLFRFRRRGPSTIRSCALRVPSTSGACAHVSHNLTLCFMYVTISASTITHIPAKLRVALNGGDGSVDAARAIEAILRHDLQATENLSLYDQKVYSIITRYAPCSYSEIAQLARLHRTTVADSVDRLKREDG